MNRSRVLGGAAAAITMLAGVSAAEAQTAVKPPNFAMCGVCHKTAAGEKPGIGPNLFGVVGRKAGAQSDFQYSTAMKNAKITWTRDKLDTYLTAPTKMVPGTKMAYAGEKDPAKRKAVIDYLATLK